MSMNLREGTRRLALLLGVVGAIGGGFVSSLELQDVLNRRARQNRFEQLAASDVVKQERKTLQAWTPVPETPPKIDPKTGERIQPSPIHTQPYSDLPPGAVVLHDPSRQRSKKPAVDYDALAERARNSTPADPYAAYGGAALDKSAFVPVPSEVNKGGIRTITWAEKYEVYSIETEDGQTLYRTPAPSAGEYLLVALFPILGFIIPWGTIRAIGWVGAGFKLSSK